MSKKDEFINYVETVINEEEMTDNAKAYWNALKTREEKGNKQFTENGRLVMEYMQSLPSDAPAMKAKDIAEGIGITSRSVSGSMRKLVADNYIEKLGDQPACYAITDKGREVDLNN